MAWQKEFQVANPSPYERDDFVEVDLKSLGTPESLDEESLRLCRINPGGVLDDIPYQIDYILGRQAGKRMMTFLSENTPPGQEDYSTGSATYVLIEGTPKQFDVPSNTLWVGHYYNDRRPNDAGKGGFDYKWDKARGLNGVKLYNTTLEAYFSLVPPQDRHGVDYTGSATSIRILYGPNSFIADNALCPYEDYSASRWGQLTEVVFFPLPWSLDWFQRVTLLGKRYDLVWSSSGPLRAVVTLKSAPMTIKYTGAPFFDPKEKEIKCNLYRVIYVYRDKPYPYYSEELFVQTDAGDSISFRPYYYSLVHAGEMFRELRRFEHIPDYFSMWVGQSPQWWGYGFAADAHVRGIHIDGDEIRWRLPLTHHNKCTHLFMMNNDFPKDFDRFQDVGHLAWYERVFKPLEVIPLARRYPSPEPPETG